MTESWEGFYSDVLEGVKQIVQDNRAAIGVQEVRVGEKYRDFLNPACFVFEGKGGARIFRESERKDVTEYSLPVRVMIVDKNLAVSTDKKVQRMLEKILDALDQAPPPGRSKSHTVDSPGAVLPVFDGKMHYATSGIIDLTFYADIERTR